ncbi:MAG: acetoin utilization protein AcuC [Actinomycetota bacterium]|nr:acetoin utilization protein AcuC [Actinomycetota bacterium]
MSDSVGLVAADENTKTYDFGAAHPLRPERFLLTYENIRSLGLSERANVREISARAASDEEILAVHDAEYVEIVKRIDAGERVGFDAVVHGFGTSDNPVFKGMHAASAAVCGGSVVAAENVVSGEVQHVFNPPGGLHHARRREASGFCIYNDAAAAIAKALALEPSWRVMYVDVDVHHGDGVQWIFYEEPRVLTVSLHQTGETLYPGTGFENELGDGEARGTSANVPLSPLTGDDDYLWALEQVVPQLAEAFRPHLFVTQLGADTHRGDPLANLGLTMPAYPRIARILHETAHEFAEGRWIATGGGGYQHEKVVPRVWTIHFAEMCGAPEAIPDEWLEDKPSEETSESHRAEVETTVRKVVDACLPRLRELSGV